MATIPTSQRLPPQCPDFPRPGETAQ